MKKYFLYLLIAFFYSACSTSELTEIAIEEKNFEKTWNDCDPEHGSCASIQFNYIEISGTAYDQKINTYITDNLLNNYILEEQPQDFEELSQNFFIDFEDNIKESPDAHWVWEITEDIALHSTSRKIVCIRCENYQFLGGAHGILSTQYINFNLENGEVMTFDDFFKSGGREYIGGLMERQYRDFMGIPDEEALSEEGVLFDDHILPNDNFILTQDSIVFYFNPFEIASSTYGSDRFAFAKADINEYFIQ